MIGGIGQLIRESLEGVLSRDRVSLVLASLARHHGVPRTQKDAIEWVRGPLREELSALLSEDASLPVIRDLLRTLGDDGRGDVTRSFPVGPQAVQVAVVANGPTLTKSLWERLGPHCILPSHVQDADSLLEESSPAVIVIDCSDFPAIEPVPLVVALRTFKDSCTRVLLGADLPYGGPLTEALSIRNVKFVSIPASEGEEPLLDLIRSRQEQ